MLKNTWISIIQKDLPDNPELTQVKEVTSLFQVTLVEMRAEFGIVNRFLVLKWVYSGNSSWCLISQNYAEVSAVTIAVEGKGRPVI